MMEAASERPASNRPGRGYERTVRALQLFAESSAPLTVDGVVEALETPRSTTWLMLQHFRDLGIIESHADRRFAAGPALLSLGLRVVGNLPLRAAARDALEELCRSTTLDVFLGQVIGSEPVPVDHLAGVNSVDVESHLGLPSRWNSASLGQAILAFGPRDLREAVLRGADFPPLTPLTITAPDKLSKRLKEAQRIGYVIACDESVMGLGAIAVPIYAHESELAGVIGVQATTSHLRSHEVRLVGALQQASQSITRRLGRQRMSPI